MEIAGLFGEIVGFALGLYLIYRCISYVVDKFIYPVNNEDVIDDQ